MQTQIKVIVVIIIAVFMSVLFSSWKMSQTLSEENQQRASVYADSQSQSLRSLIHYFVKNESALIFNSLSKESGDLPDGIETLALLEKGENGLWDVEWVNGQTTEDVNELASDLPLDKVSIDNQIWMRITDINEQAKIVALNLVKVLRDGNHEERVALSVFQMQALSSINILLKNNTDLQMVVDHEGYALAYPEQQYLGAKVEEHPIVSMLLKEKDLNYKGSFVNEKGLQAIGVYEKVPGTNLYVVSESVPASRFSLASGHFLKTIFFAIALMIIFSLIAFVLITPEVKSLEYLRASIIKLGQRLQLEQPDFLFPNGVNVLSVLHRLKLPEGEEVLPLAPEADVIGSPVANESESSTPAASAPAEPTRKENLVHDFGFGISRSLRGPISAILGHAQIASSKSTDETLKEHFKVIEGEARKSRDIVEGLAQYVGDHQPTIESLNFQSLVENIISDSRSHWVENGIQIQENISSSGPVRIDNERVSGALRGVIGFLEAHMLNSENKNLIFNLGQSDQLVKLTIKSEGAPFTSADEEKYFQPFQTQSKEAPLALSLACALVESSGGELKLNHGQAAVTFEFPLNTEALVSSTVEEVSQVEEANVEEPQAEAASTEEEAPVEVAPSEEEAPGTTEMQEVILAQEMDEDPLLAVTNNEVESPEEIMGLKPLADGDGPELPEIPLETSDKIEVVISEEPQALMAFNEEEAISEVELTQPAENSEEVLEEVVPTTEFQEVQIRKPKVRGKH